MLILVHSYSVFFYFWLLPRCSSDIQKRPVSSFPGVTECFGGIVSMSWVEGKASAMMPRQEGEAGSLLKNERGLSKVISLSFLPRTCPVLALHSGKPLSIMKTGQFAQEQPSFKTKSSVSWGTSQTHTNQGDWSSYIHLSLYPPLSLYPVCYQLSSFP